MNKLWRTTAKFMNCDVGATYLEYSFLLWIMLMAPLTVIWSVGDWASVEWGDLVSLLDSIGGTSDDNAPHVCCANAAAANVPGNCCS